MSNTDDIFSNVYIWETTNSDLVFVFMINAGDPPESMSLMLYPGKSSTSGMPFESTDGEITFSNTMVNDVPLNGRLWLNNSGADHGYVEADLKYGAAPEEEEFLGAMIEYAFTPDPA